MDRKYQIDYDYLKSNFQQPDRTYGVNCWWWWLNGNVTKEAITKDLEAMKSRNFQGAMIFDAGGHNQRGNKDIPAGPLFGSEEWTELFVFALDEAKRLGLDSGQRCSAHAFLAENNGVLFESHWAPRQIKKSADAKHQHSICLGRHSY